MSTTLEITADIFNALATQTQSLIDELSAHNYSEAMQTAHQLLGNISAGAATVRHEAAVDASALQEQAQAAAARLEQAVHDAAVRQAADDAAAAKAQPEPKATVPPDDDDDEPADPHKKKK
jgi:hypothetical protein